LKIVSENLGGEVSLKHPIWPSFMNQANRKERVQASSLKINLAIFTSSFLISASTKFLPKQLSEGHINKKNNDKCIVVLGVIFIPWIESHFGVWL
jgi:hypothetical protein